MKCDKLKVYGMADPAIGDEYEMYKVTEVDEAIAELKQKLHDVDNQWNEQCKEIAELKAENERLKKEVWEADERAIDAGATSVEKMEEMKATKRSLWLARANRAVCEIDYWRKCYEHVDDYFDVRTGQDLEAKRCEKMIRNWIDVKSKCLKKAEECK